MKHIPFFHKIVVIIVVLNLTSCCSSTEDTILLNEETLEWKTDDPPKSNFTMIDNNGISQIFTFKSNRQYFIKSTSSSFCSESILNEEHVYQKYVSDFGNQFQISLTTAFDNTGDDIYIVCAKTGFGYDSKNKVLNRINTPFGNYGQSFNPDGTYRKVLSSTVKILGNYSTSYHDYEQVMCFELKDYKNKWTNNLVTKIYVAKRIGLIKYELNNGIYYERK